MKTNDIILLVDDEDHVRKYVRLILQRLGPAMIVEGRDGQEALAMYESARPKLVLLDISMPVMDGLSTLRKLRELDPQCVVIMLTSLVTRQHVETALALGAAGYIRKDTPKDEIARAIAEVIEETAGAKVSV